MFRADPIHRIAGGLEPNRAAVTPSKSISACDLGTHKSKGAEWVGKESDNTECHLDIAGHSILGRICPNAASIPEHGSSC